MYAMGLKRRKFTVAATTSIYPQRKRYAEQLYCFYRSLARQFDVDVVLLTERGSNISKQEIAPGLVEIKVAKSAQHRHAEAALQQTIGVPICDVSIPKLHFLTPDYLEGLLDSARDSDFLVTSHPYFFPILKEIRKNNIWYEAHNVEGELQKSVLPKTSEGFSLLKEIQSIELECCKESELIFTFSNELTQGIKKKYAIYEDKILTLSSASSAEALPYVSYEQRLQNKKRLGLNEQFIVIFMGSRYSSYTCLSQSVNSDDIRSVLKLASKLPDIIFLVLGNSGQSFNTHMSPPNVSFMGIVSQDVKSLIFSIADAAVHFARSESPSVTMLDYLSSGIPVISTDMGAETLKLEYQKHCLIAKLWNFSEVLSVIQNEDLLIKKERLKNASDYVSKNYGWDTVTEKIGDWVNRIYESSTIQFDLI